MNSEGKRPFIPRNKPKSWIVLTISCLSSVAIGLGSVLFENALGYSAGKWLVAAMAGCFVTALLSGLVYVRGLLTGRYRSLQERSWREQVW